MSNLINIQLTLNNDGTCSSTFCDNGEKVISDMKTMKDSGDDFNPDSLNSVEKTFMCVLNTLYGVSQVGQVE